MNQIVHNLWLGGQADADDLIRDNPDRITAILNVRGVDAYTPAGRNQAAEHKGKAYLYIPAPDIGIVYPRQVLEANRWLQEQTEKGERILIHCKQGVSRSPAFLASFMVESGISPDLEAAKAAILARRAVNPARVLAEWIEPAAMTSALTGLPNRKAFDQGKPGSLVAVADVDRMAAFNGSFGQIAGDALLRRLAKILTEAGLDAYHQQGDEFLCKGESYQELNAKLSQARQIFREPFEVYAEGRIQSVEETDFSFGIAAAGQEQAARSELKRAATGKGAPEWLRKIIGAGGRGQDW
jgi:GGDEF domain-containing protein